MIQMAREKYAKKEYVIKDVLPNHVEYAEKVFLGAMSHTTTKTNMRLLFKPAITWGLCEVPCTPPETARYYLDVVHQTRLRASREQHEQITQHRSAPLYYRPCHIDNGVYVDVKSAYLQIMDVVGWNVDYHPRKFLSAGRPPLDFPLRDDKIARNSLVTAGVPSSVTVWTGYKLVETHPQNVHINLGLYALIHDILHEIANIAVAYGAFYVATDGYILEDMLAEAFIHHIETEFRLKLAVKDYGETKVTGVGSYMCGEHITERFHWQNDKPYSNLYHVHDEMLVKTFRAIARNRIDKPHYTVLDLR